MMPSWAEGIILTESIVSTGLDGQPPILTAGYLPADEVSQIDERYHDKEADIYDSYSDIPRVALAERWIVPWMCKQVNGVVVDLGCGTARVTMALLDRSQRVIAVDRSLGMLRRARAKIGRGHALLLRSDARRMPIRESSVDAVICSGVLHHMPVWPEAIAEIGRVLKPGGRLVVREPSARYVANLFSPAERVLGWIADRLPGRRADPEGEWDPSLSPVESPIRLSDVNEVARANGLIMAWSGSAMLAGSLGIPERLPLHRAYFTVANAIDRAALRLTHQPYGALVLAVFVKSEHSG